MELLLQFLDDFEDLVYAVALSAERIRHFVIAALVPVLICGVALGATLLT